MLTQSTPSDAQVIGRFAPSPSGPLHLGSLYTAVASYLDAKSQGGHWLLRIEDLDPPREQAGASQAIIQTLLAHGLQWDGNVLYQSEQSPLYQHYLETLQTQSLCYNCSCNRKRLLTLKGYYDRHCLHQNISKEETQTENQAAIRLLCDEQLSDFIDRLQGPIHPPLPENKALHHDFIIKRKDGLWAYQLAVVVDDINSDVNSIVRGIDILDSTAKQLQLYRYFKATAPSYLHLPVLSFQAGQKLSKQNHAQAVDNQQAFSNIHQVLQLLGQATPHHIESYDTATLLDFAIKHYNPENIPQSKELII